jgi:hypothetical protein
VLIINTAFTATRLVTLRGEVLIAAMIATRPFGHVKRGEYAVWDPLSQWSQSGYRGGCVSEGQLMEIKEETIRD